jgi:hypothetical protein
MRGEVRLRLSVTWFRPVSRANFDFRARYRVHVPATELACSRSGQGDRRCCHAGDALLPFALGWLRARKLPSIRDWFTAHPVPLSGSMSRGFRNPPLRCGREATEPRRPISKRRGVVSRADQVRLRRRPIGPRSSDKQFGSIRSDRFRWMCHLCKPNRGMLFQRRVCDLASLSQT